MIWSWMPGVANPYPRSPEIYCPFSFYCLHLFYYRERKKEKHYRYISMFDNRKTLWFTEFPFYRFFYVEKFSNKIYKKIQQEMTKFILSKNVILKCELFNYFILITQQQVPELEHFVEKHLNLDLWSLGRRISSQFSLVLKYKLFVFSEDHISFYKGKR